MPAKPKAPKQRPAASEHALQSACYLWTQTAAAPIAARDIYAIPNGGKRHVLTAVKLKREGVRSGIPDMFLPAACGHYHGLYIELKNGTTNTTSENQNYWMERLMANGYACCVARSFDEFKAIVTKYTNLTN